MEEIDSIIASMTKKPRSRTLETPPITAVPNSSSSASSAASSSPIVEEAPAVAKPSTAPPPPPPPPPKGFHDKAVVDSAKATSDTQDKNPQSPPPPPPLATVPSSAQSPRSSAGGPPPPPPPPPKGLLTNDSAAAPAASPAPVKPLNLTNGILNNPVDSTEDSTATGGTEDHVHTPTRSQSSSTNNNSGSKPNTPTPRATPRQVAELGEPVIATRPGLKLKAHSLPKLVPTALETEEAEKAAAAAAKAPKPGQAKPGSAKGTYAASRASAPGAAGARSARADTAASSVAPQPLSTLLGDLSGDTTVKYSDSKYVYEGRAEGAGQSQHASAIAAIIGGNDVVRYTDSKQERIENPTRDAVAARRALFSQPAPADESKSTNFSPRSRTAVSTDLKTRREELEAKLLACKTAEKGTGAAGSNNGTARLSADGPTTAVVKNPPLGTSSSSPSLRRKSSPPALITGPLVRATPKLSVKNFANAYFDVNLISEMLARGHKRSKILDAMCECYMHQLSSNDPDLLERKIKELKLARKYEQKEKRERKMHKKDKKKSAAATTAVTSNVLPAAVTSATAIALKS